MTRWVAFALVLLLAHPAAASDDEKRWGLPSGFRLLDRIVAIADAEVITLFELNRSFAPLMAIGLTIPDDQERSKWLVSRRRDVLDEQVDLILILSEARKLELDMEPARVQAYLRGLKEQQGLDDSQFAGYVRSAGFPSVAAYSEFVGKQMLKARMVNIKIGSRIQASADDVDRIFRRDYYGGKKQDEVCVEHILFRIPELATVQKIRQIRGLANNVRATAMAERQSFRELAREHSEDEKSKKYGGDIGCVTRGSLDPEFERHIFALPTGQISEVVRSSVGLHIIRVTQRNKVDISDPGYIKSLIRRDLENKNREKAYDAWVKYLRADHHVDIRL